MKLLILSALLIATSHIVEAQTPVYQGYVQTQRPAGGVDQPNAQFIRNQMEQQRQQVDIGNAQLQQWNNIRSYELIYGGRRSP
jgi:hypothetical protein